MKAAVTVTAVVAAVTVGTVVPAVPAVPAVAATVKSAPTRWADRHLMKTRQRARTTRAMLMRL